MWNYLPFFKSKRIICRLWYGLSAPPPAAYFRHASGQDLFADFSKLYGNFKRKLFDGGHVTQLYGINSGKLPGRRVPSEA